MCLFSPAGYTNICFINTACWISLKCMCCHWYNFLIYTNIHQISMSVHRPHASTGRARILPVPTSVPVTRDGRARSVTKVKNGRDTGSSKVVKFYFWNLINYLIFDTEHSKLSWFHFLVDINECLSTPCVHGSCVNTLGSFQCSCEPGWTGTLCDQGLLYHFSVFVNYNRKKIQVYFVVKTYLNDDDISDINECLQSPCVHGQCSDTLGSYRCTCDVGWTGTNCQTGNVYIYL